MALITLTLENETVDDSTAARHARRLVMWSHRSPGKEGTSSPRESLAIAERQRPELRALPGRGRPDQLGDQYTTSPLLIHNNAAFGYLFLLRCIFQYTARLYYHVGTECASHYLLYNQTTSDRIALQRFLWQAHNIRKWRRSGPPHKFGQSVRRIRVHDKDP